MSEEERKEFIEIIEKYHKKVSGNKKAARELLYDAGIITKKGNLRRNYKHLCILLGQG
jgi:hypothetical protein